MIPPGTIKQAMEMQVEADRRKREEILQSEGDQLREIHLAQGEQQDCDSVEQHSSVQDPGAQAQSKQKRTRDQQAKHRENQ